jgi:hypothetical protein
MIDILIPVNDLNNETNINLFKTALESLNQQVSQEFNVVITCKKDVKEQILTYVKILTKTPSYVIHDLNTYQEIINNAVNELHSDYFLILEQDDELLPHHIKNFYVYNKGQSLILNLPLEINDKNEVMGIRNEIFWAAAINNNIGNIDAKTGIDNFNNLSMDGAFINREVFKEVNGIKTKIEIYFNQEFILRCANNGYDVFIMPKVGIKHMMGREGSYFDNCKDFENDVKIKYYDKAQKEYLINRDI